MKTAILLSLVSLAVVPVRAQLLRPEAVNGAVLGGVAGAVIGHNSGDLRHNGWKGAAIGAGAGMILGQVIGNANAAATDVRVPRSGGYVYRDRPEVYVGVRTGSGPRYRSSGYGYGPVHHPRIYSGRGYSGHGWGPSVYRSVPAYNYYPGYGDAYPYYSYPSGSAASTGLLLGSLAGGVIGHNSGDFRHNGWRGAAWGAGIGWLLGSVVDSQRRAQVYTQAPVVMEQAPAVQVAAPPAAPAQPQQVTIINNYYNAPTPMSSANGLFGR